jgi:hypothetical protein
MGLDVLALETKILVVKSTNHFFPAFQAIACAVIYVDTALEPGCGSPYPSNPQTNEGTVLVFEQDFARSRSDVAIGVHNAAGVEARPCRAMRVANSMPLGCSSSYHLPTLYIMSQHLALTMSSATALMTSRCNI